MPDIGTIDKIVAFAYRDCILIEYVNRNVAVDESI